MQDLKFQNFIFDEDSLNYTVRLGEKKYHELKPGEEITLIPTELNNHNYRMGIVRELIKGHYSSIVQYVYDRTGNPNSYTKSDINWTMRAAYKDSFSLEEDPIVTCIAFTLQK